MINGERVLAVIPARGGSKRVPRKNLREYRGKPLIQWAIEAARGSRYLDQITLTSDDEEILSTATGYGLCNVVPRPAHLATDGASNEDVLRYELQRFNWINFVWVVLLQPTSPLRTAEDIDACIERAQLGHGCISVNRATGIKNGAVYVARASWIAEHDFTHLGLMRYAMPEERSLDIDTEADFAR